jgi:uncharacterized protein (DUF3820 family)
VRSIQEQLAAIRKMMNKLPTAPIAYLIFGKYKGKLISEVATNDEQYLRWLLDQENLDLIVRKKIEETLALL